jgi:hypothetical protein
MKKGGIGGSHTAREGSSFEVQVDEILMNDLNRIGYNEVLIQRLSGEGGPIHGRTLQSQLGDKIEIFYKSGIYRLFFEPQGIDYKNHFSARLEPDIAIYSEKEQTLTIVEIKQMTAAGSVAEKLQTCDYKRFYYESLSATLSIKIAISWVLGEYFKVKENQFQSIYEYMLSKGSNYYFGYLPVEEIDI